jgi:hypothetical protein
LKRALPWIVTAVVLAFYGRLLGRYFTSEDFLLIRFLSENPPWRDLGALFTAPWLEISVVKFYRPVSTLLYGLEIATFGANPVGYNVVHVLVHALNAVLVGLIARQLTEGEDVPAFAATLLFAIYPLHPNAVIFGASFATLFAGTFLFGSLLAWLRSARLLALGLFALALGSYEAAVVFPAVLATHDHLLARRRSRVPGYLPFFVLAGLYLLLRKSLFGVFIGGYEEQGRSLLSPQIGPLLKDLAASIFRLHVPIYDWELGTWATVAFCALLIGVPLAVLWMRRRAEDNRLRLWLFAWVWTLASLAPFAFRPSVPANGRYWYLAAAGVVLSLSFLARKRGGFLAPVALFWGVLLHGYLGVYQEAGETARSIQSGLVRSGGASFLTGHPDFLTNEAGVPIAQVLRYGVWDAVHPPFVQAAVPAYPLPPLRDLELLPIVRGAPGSRIDQWDPQLRQLRQVVPPSGPTPAELTVLGPTEGALVDPAREELQVAVPSGQHVRFRLIVVSRGNPAVIDLGPEAVQGGTLRTSFPDDFCRTMHRLYGGEMFWWIEARDAAGGVSGFTPMRSFQIAE